jgi:hypothetical protein
MKKKINYGKARTTVEGGKLFSNTNPNQISFS